MSGVPPHLPYNKHTSCCGSSSGLLRLQLSPVMSPLLLLLNLLCFLTEAYSQTVPYVSFMGQTLANHAFVDLSLVGSDFDFSDSVQCHTDLSTCCSGAQGPHRGDWFFPDGTRLPFSGSGNIFEIRSSQSVYLQRINGETSPSGIYRCDIPTVAISTVDDISVRETIYLGAYASGGNIAKYKHRCFLSAFRDTNKHITRLLGIGTLCTILIPRVFCCTFCTLLIF